MTGAGLRLGFAGAGLRLGLTAAALAFRPAFGAAGLFRFADFNETPRPFDGLTLFFIHPSFVLLAL